MLLQPVSKNYDKNIVYPQKDLRKPYKFSIPEAKNVTSHATFFNLIQCHLVNWNMNEITSLEIRY